MIKLTNRVIIFSAILGLLGCAALGTSINAYTLPRKTPNSRVEDLVDILLLIEKGKLKTYKLQNALSKTFMRIKTHDIPSDLPDPPDTWNTPFKKMAETSGLPGDLHSAIDRIRQFYKTIINK